MLYTSHDPENSIIQFNLIIFLYDLEERYAVALEEEEDLVEVGRHVERVVEEVEVHLRRQELHRQLPEWEAVKTHGVRNQLINHKLSWFEPEKVSERESTRVSVVVVVRRGRLAWLQ